MRHTHLIMLALGAFAGCVLATEDVGTAQSQSTACDCPGDGFGFGTHLSPNNLDQPHNWTMHLGWNISAEGNPIVAGEPAFFDSWESNWQTPPQLPGGPRWMERHWQYRAADGVTSRRPLSSVIDRETHAPQVHVGAKFVVNNSLHSEVRLNILDAPAGQASVMLMGNPNAATPIKCDNHATACLQQRSSVGGTVHLINVDSLDRVVIGGGGAQGLRFYTAQKPTVVDLDSVISALAELGLVTDGR